MSLGDNSSNFGWNDMHRSSLESSPERRNFDRGHATCSAACWLPWKAWRAWSSSCLHSSSANTILRLGTSSCQRRQPSLPRCLSLSTFRQKSGMFKSAPCRTYPCRRCRRPLELSRPSTRATGRRVCASNSGFWQRFPCRKEGAILCLTARGG
jgi:hypothetical protein